MRSAGVGSLREQVDEAIEKGTEAAPKPSEAEMVPRVLPIGITYYCPKSQAKRRVEVISTVIDDSDRRTKFDRYCRGLREGAPAALFTESELYRHRCLARVWVQAEFKDEAFSAHIEVDDSVLGFLGGALELHERRWFRGSGSPEQMDARGPSVECVALGLTGESNAAVPSGSEGAPS